MSIQCRFKLIKEEAPWELICQGSLKKIRWKKHMSLVKVYISYTSWLPNHWSLFKLLLIKKKKRKWGRGELSLKNIQGFFTEPKVKIQLSFQKELKLGDGMLQKPQKFLISALFSLKNFILLLKYKLAFSAFSFEWLLSIWVSLLTIPGVCRGRFPVFRS